jgi:saccharopine dehydrogenase (NAD+, L-lysine-forming)
MGLRMMVLPGLGSPATPVLTNAPCGKDGVTMAQVLVIGAGGVGSVAVHKMAMNADIFTGIALASRTKSKCDAIAASVKERTGVDVATYQIDADDVAATTALINDVKPVLVVNLRCPTRI